MSTLQIEKFVDGKHEKTIQVPTMLISAAKHLLPQAALAALASKDINIEDILTAQKQGLPYSKSINVQEDGVDKTVTLTLSVGLT